MCGLFGVFSSGNLDTKTKEVVNILAYLSIYRGKDSSGIATVDSKNQVSLLKEALPTPDFLKLPSVKEEFTRYDLRAIIGHARHATVGGTSIKGAHPFEFPSIVGAHNGTIDSICIRRYLEDGVKHVTDSEGIYNKIDKSSFEEVIPELEGAWALTAYDKVTNKLKIIRNDKRPLFWALSADKKTLFWASEEIMLWFAFDRVDIKMLEDQDKEVAIFQFPEDQLFSIFPDDSGILKREAVKLKSTKIYTNKSSYNTNYGTSYTTSPPAANAAKEAFDRQQTNKNNVVPFPQLTYSPTDVRQIITPFADEITGNLYQKTAYDTLMCKDEFLEHYNHKCVLCDQKVDYEKGLFLTKDAPIDPICHNCLEEDPYLLALAEKLNEAA